MRIKLALGILGMAVVGNCAQAQDAAPTQPAPKGKGKAARAERAAKADAPGRKPGNPVKRGEYLVNAMGCGDCHTPMKMTPIGPAPDATRLLSGHPEAMKLPPPPKLSGPWLMTAAATNTAFAGPWGISYSANLTPDTNTGIGIWTEEMFITTIREGKHMGTSRPVQPPMPWPSFKNLNDNDIKAIFAYLKSIPAITNHVPDYAPPAGASGEGAPAEVKLDAPKNDATKPQPAGK